MNFKPAMKLTFAGLNAGVNYLRKVKTLRVKQRNFIGGKRNNQNYVSLPDKCGRPIYVGSTVWNHAGFPRRVLALNSSTTDSSRAGALLLSSLESNIGEEMWGFASEYTVVKP